ncbi:MAG: flagellar biosynthesis repressor FlbT [Rhodospirillales bacterium]
MPLKIDFKSGDKMVVNGAVVENVGPNTKMLVHNESAILREKEVLSTADTNTPASRVYFALQCAYIFPEKAEEYTGVFRNLLAQYVAACPSAMQLSNDITGEVNEGHIYKALKKTHMLIAHEVDTIKGLEQDVKDGKLEEALSTEFPAETTDAGGE